MADVSTQFHNGFLRCDFSHAARYTVDRRPVDLSSGDLYLMVASGPGQCLLGAAPSQLYMRYGAGGRSRVPLCAAV